MKNRLFQRLSAFAVAGAMAVSFATVPVAATELPEHEHNWVSQQTEVATCQKAGFVNYKCDCGETKTETLPQKTEHTYNAEGKCSVCGAENPELLTVADPNANNAEGTQTDGNGEQSKTDGGESQSTENKGDTQNTDGKGETTDGAQNTDGKGETTDGAQNTDGKGETTDGAQNTDGKGETTDGAQNTDGKGETTDGAQNTDGKGETTDGAQNTDGKGETTETSKPTEGNGETTETSKPTEGKDETTGSTETTEGLTEEEQAAQESAKRVAEVQALIDALRTEVPEEELEAEKAKFDAVTAALATLTEEEKAKLNLTNYQALEELLALLPATLEEKAEGTVTTEQELRDAIAQGGDVVLANDITLTSEIAVNDANYPGLNLDLGGHTITGSAQKLIQFYYGANITIKNGKITNTNKGLGVCVYVKANTNLTLQDLTLTTTGNPGNNNKNQPVTVSNPATGSTNVTIDNCKISGGENSMGLTMMAPGTVTIRNGSVLDGGIGGYGFYVQAPVTATIENSTLSGFTAVYAKKPEGDRLGAKGSTITVNGSTLTGVNPHGPSQNEFATIQLEAPVTIEINNSTLVANGTGDYNQYILGANEEYLTAGSNVTFDKTTTIQLAGHEGKNFLLDPYFYADDHITENTIKIPSKYASMLDADLKLDADNRVVQKINSEERLRAAIEKGGTVTVDADIELSKPLVIANGKEVTLDLNGKTLSDKAGSLVEGGPDSLIVVDNGATLTVTDTGTAGKISSSMYGIKLTRDSTYGEGQNTAKLVVNGGTIEAQIFAITGNGRRHNTDITINGGTVIGTGAGIYQPQNGKLTINGGTVKGGTGVEIRSGKLTVTGGVIASTETEFKIEEKGNKNGSTTTGAAVAVVPHTTNLDVKVTIENGTLTAPHALHEENVQGSMGKVQMEVNNGQFNGTVEAKTATKFIKGGTFSEPPKEELAKDHFSFEEKPDGTFELKEDPYIIDGEGHKDYIDPANPDAPVSLDKMLENNAQKNDPKITLGANGVVNDAHTMSGKLTMEVNGHKITGTGSISGKLTLKNLYANGTHLALPQGGKVTFQNGSVQVSVGDMAGPDKSFGYSKPIQITYNGHDYTYFLAIGGSNDGKLSIDANGKPIVSGQHYVVKAKVEKIEKFTMTGIYNGSVTSNDFYKNTNATLQFVTDAPATALEVGFVTVDGKQITDSSCFSVTSGDTAAVTLSNKYLRSLSIGVHTLQMHFKDGKTVYGIFSVRTTSNADSSNPKTGDTIFLPIAVMTLSLTALAVLMPRKKKFF